MVEISSISLVDLVSIREVFTTGRLNIFKIIAKISSRNNETDRK